MLEEGQCPTPTVFEENPRESLILQPNGQPYQVESRRKIGFDLTPKKVLDRT